MQDNPLQYFSRTIFSFPHHQLCSIAPSVIISQKYDAILLHINPLNAELNPICHLLALLGAHHILHVSRIRVNPIYDSKFFMVFVLALGLFFPKIKSYLVSLQRPCGERMQLFYVLNNQHRLIPRLGQESTPVAARSKAWVSGRSLAEIMGSNLAEGNDACLLWASCVVK